MNLYRFISFVIRYLVYIFNGKPMVEGLDHIPHDRPVILAATHRSFLDPVYLLTITPGHQISFMGKESVFKIPLIGWLIKKIGVIPVNREKPSRRSIMSAIKAMNEDGHHFGIFPSGTRYSTEIKSGTAFIQGLSKRDIVPIVIQPPSTFWEFITRRKAKIAIGSPILYRRHQKYDREMLEEVDQLIIEDFKTLDEALDPNYEYIPPLKKTK